MKSLSRLNKYFLRYKWRLLLGIIFTVVSNYFGVKMPKFIQESIDSLQTSGIDPNIHDALWISFQMGMLYIGLSATKGFFLFLMRQTIIVMSRYVEFDIKNDIFAHYQILDAAFYKKNRIGDLMNRISEDVGQVRMYVGPGVMYTINLIVLTVLSISQMVQINAKLTGFALLPLPLMSFIIYKVSNKINKASKETQEAQSNISTIAQESFAGIRVIKAYNQIFPTFTKLESASNDYKLRSMKLVFINALFMPTIMFLIGLSTLLVIYVGGLLTGTKALSLGSIVAFLFYVNNLTWPFVSIGWVTSIIQRAAASQKRINEFLEQTPIITNPSNKPFDLVGKIQFKNVSYTYENTGIQALKNISFTIDSGSTFGILGRTGSGKSTLLSMIQRQVDPTNGEIFIDNLPLISINLVAYRNATSIVPQEVFLFSDSIKHNVLFGTERKCSDAEIIGYLKKAHVWHNIEEFPQQLDTQLGELGVNLSGGQKQRISIARALIREPKMMLLDDCLSAVDTETEEIILNNLNNNNTNVTKVLVSHRISTLRNCNEIIVLDKGEIIEHGTHASLMELKGAYYETYLMQLQEESKE
jgi:ATP-binding cassette subfamily B protein